MSDELKAMVVGKMQQYIEEHLKEPITLSELARAVGYSQYYAARIFKEETGLPPFEYIRRQRLIRAAHMLRREKSKVLDVAFDFVFDSHEGFTRAFTNAFGISPKKFGNSFCHDGWRVPYYYLDRRKIKLEDKHMKNSTYVIFTQIVQRPARKLIVRRSKKAAEYFEYCSEVGCGTPDNPSPWDVLCGIKEALYEPVGVWLPKEMRLTEEGVYAHAVEVAADYSGAVPEGFDVIDLKPCKYLIFQGEPYEDDNYQDAVGACMERIRKFNPEVYGYRYCEESFPKFQLAPMGWRGYIEGIPVVETDKN